MDLNHVSPKHNTDMYKVLLCYWERKKACTVDSDCLSGQTNYHVSAWFRTMFLPKWFSFRQGRSVALNQVRS